MFCSRPRANFPPPLNRQTAGSRHQTNFAAAAAQNTGADFIFFKRPAPGTKISKNIFKALAFFG